jgi:hypothetical protein
MVRVSGGLTDEGRICDEGASRMWPEKGAWTKLSDCISKSIIGNPQLPVLDGPLDRSRDGAEAVQSTKTVRARQFGSLRRVVKQASAVFFRVCYERRPKGWALLATPNRGTSSFLRTRRADLRRSGLAPQARDLSTFANLPPQRGEVEAHRLVFVGELSPLGGCADLQHWLSLAAEVDTKRVVDITWVGEGTLRPVLDSQPLSPNMRQRFVSVSGEADLVGLFSGVGILVIPPFAGADSVPVREAMAAGLLVACNTRDPMLRIMVVHGHSGWHFNPLQPALAVEVLHDILSATVDRLNEMRLVSRGMMLSSISETVTAGAPAVLAGVL